MINRNITIINKLGLHARASAKFVSTASQFSSKINVTKDAHTVNGKSIMGILTLGAGQYVKLFLEIDGPDEIQMEQALLALINDRFGESE